MKNIFSKLYNAMSSNTNTTETPAPAAPAAEEKTKGNPSKEVAGFDPRNREVFTGTTKSGRLFVKKPCNDFTQYFDNTDEGQAEHAQVLEQQLHTTQ